MGKEGCASISFEEDIVVAWSLLGVFSNLSIEIGTRKLAARWLQRECPDLSGPLFFDWHCRVLIRPVRRSREWESLCKAGPGDEEYLGRNVAQM